MKRKANVFICAFLIAKLLFLNASFADDPGGTSELKFDKVGALILTTIDKKATSAVTYKTIGWTIFNATRTKSAVVPFEAYKSETLPEGNVNTYYKQMQMSYYLVSGL
jgi:hypothetical protein